MRALEQCRHFDILEVLYTSRATPLFPGQCKEPLPVCQQAEIIRDCFVRGRRRRLSSTAETWEDIWHSPQW